MYTPNTKKLPQIEEAWVAIFIFNVPARTMKRKRFALAGVPLLTRLGRGAEPMKDCVELPFDDGGFTGLKVKKNSTTFVEAVSRYASLSFKASKPHHLRKYLKRAGVWFIILLQFMFTHAVIHEPYEKNVAK